ncbi:hypothetical protein L7F22_069125 [Adiantum nelumboides]|nr:hypothetical protein [Adiantum nelumboides]
MHKEMQNMFEKVRVPLLGLIENMRYFKCPHCEGKSHIFGCGGVPSTTKDMNLELLGEVPLNIEVRCLTLASLLWFLLQIVKQPKFMKV